MVLVTMSQGEEEEEFVPRETQSEFHRRFDLFDAEIDENAESLLNQDLLNSSVEH